MPNAHDHRSARNVEEQLSYRFKINAAWLVLGGGSLGFAYQYLLG